MSPFELEFLLHCYCKPSKHPQADNEIIKSWIKHLLLNNIIEQITGNDFYTCTEKGVVWVDHILSTKMPIQIWVRNTEAANEKA